MNERIKYPYSKIFFDVENQEHFVTHTDKNRHGHAVERSIGGGLIDFITMDFSAIQTELDLMEQEIVGKPELFYRLSYEKYKNKFFDLAQTLDGKHRYVYFYLIGQLNNIFCDITLSDERQLQSTFGTFADLLRYQKRFDFGVHMCFDVDNLPQYTLPEKIVAFTVVYPEYVNFTFKTSLAVSPTYKGKLDFDKVEYINKKEVGTKELLRLIHTDHAGVSLASYTLIESLHEMLFFEFTEMAKQGLRVKKCGLCERYFILQSKHEAEYCDRIYRNNRSCKQFGSKKAFNERVAADPVLKEYQRIYKRYFARGDRPFDKYPDSKFYNISFDKWAKIATELRKQYRNGEIDGDTLIEKMQG